MKQLIAELLKKAMSEKGIELPKKEIENLIEIPPSSEFGDYSFPCFFLKKKLKEDPAEIAKEIKKKVSSSEFINSVKTLGPYINFFMDKKRLAEDVISKILKQKDNYGKNNSGKAKKILVEFSSPNIAKPFGIGHLRSTIIGNSLARISEFNNYNMIRMNYLGDWGTQFGKIIFGYKKFGKPSELKSGDAMKHLLEIYVKANKKIYEKQAQKEFRKLEQGDKKNLELWKKFKEISLKDFKRIYKLLGIKFDIYSGESSYNNSLGSVLRVLKHQNLIEESKGALIVNLEKFNLGVALIQKTDGTTIYLTRDIAAAIDRYKKYKFDRMIYEVGQEQNLHFRQLFKILELIGCGWAENCVHVSHGLYLDKNGKKFATRKGKTIFMEDILNETISLAKKEIKKRFPKISQSELNRRALKIAIAAIFYGDLKNNRLNNIVFDIKRFVSFEGDTGPYLLYSYARASSIIKKAKKKLKKQSQIKTELEKTEFELVKKLSQFPQIVLDAYKNLNPSVIANYSYQISQMFNEFYHSCPVINSDNENFRLLLVDSFRHVLKNSLYLLGIEVIEEM